MDAEKWSDFYARTKKSDGLRPAMSDLVDGFVRELRSRFARASRFEDPEEIMTEVNQMWRAVAEDHEELSAEGFERYINEVSDDFAELLD